MKALRALIPALLVLLALPVAGADAKQLTVTRGQVKATLTYASAQPSYAYKTQKLTISRAGSQLYSGVPRLKSCNGAPCSPAIGLGAAQPPLIIRDLDADGEPEVVYTAYTGGAHCCVMAGFFELAADASHYSLADHLFGNPGFAIKDLNHDGRPELLSADDAFAYRFTSYAFGGFPLLVLRYDQGRFGEITARFKGRLRADSNAFWRGYKTLRPHRDDSARGQISAWAADQYRLGRRTHALAVL